MTVPTALRPTLAEPGWRTARTLRAFARFIARGSVRTLARPLVWAPLLGLLGASPALAQREPFAPTPALEWRVVFKLINATSHAEPGELGFVREGDDSGESNEQSLRLQLTGQPLFWLDYRLDYRNVKQHLGAAPPPQAQGADLFRYRRWRWEIEEPETGPGDPPSGQTLLWYHEIDDALVRVAAGPLEIVLGRQPITWGAGRIWQPTDAFAAFSPLALDTEFKPGIDALLVSAYPFDFATVQLAYVLSPHDEPDTADSLALRWRGQVGQESEITALLATVRGESMAGGSFETTWLQAGWRIEGVAQRPQESDGTELFMVGGLDFQFSDGTALIAEVYYNTLGAATQSELAAVALTPRYQQGRLLQFSRTVLAVSAGRDFPGLWNGSYTLFGAALRDDDGARPLSLLHQLSLVYSVSDNADAVFSLLGAGGRGLAPDMNVQSEFGHVPNSFTVSLQFVL